MLWERGARLQPVDRGLLALCAALPDTTGQELADWPLGKRNKALAELRSCCFGPMLRGWMSCGQCGENLEFEVDGRVFSGGEANRDAATSEPIVVHELSFRLPTSRDLAGAARESDVHSAAVCILERCRLDGGGTRQWSDEQIEKIGDRMAMADPMAEIRLTVRCPNCGRESQETLDIAAFLWAEIESEARRLLLEVHTLATAYGWTEHEILALSDSRRALYLEMVRA
jgi:hypothetical protein